MPPELVCTALWYFKINQITYKIKTFEIFFLKLSGDLFYKTVNDTNLLVQAVYVGTIFAEKFDYLNITDVASPMQWSPLLLVLYIAIGSIL